MGWFGSKKMSFIGVDIGAGGVKLVELQNKKGRGKLMTYGFTERAPDAQPINLVDSPKDAALLLKKIAQKARVTTTKTVAGLPTASVFSSVINVPKTDDEKEQKEAIEWQARKLIPVPLEEMVLDFKRITPPETAARPANKPSGKETKKDGKEGQGAEKEEEKKKAAEKKEEKKTEQVLITGASKSMVQKYVNVFKMAGLELVSLETETFALTRALVGKDRSTTMIVDMGAVRTNIIIVENGIPFVTRSLDAGGVMFTKIMSKILSIDLKSAEQMKCDIKGVSTLYPGDNLPRIFETAVAPMITEMQYSMNLYVTQNEGSSPKSIEKVILTGGSAGLPVLASYMASKLNIKTYVGDPWARIVYPEGLRPVLDEIGPRYSVAIGLAMRDIE